MSLIKKLKSLLPVSSRSLHATEKYFVDQNSLIRNELSGIKSMQNETFHRIEQTYKDMNIKCDAISSALAAEAERNKLRMEALMKKAYPEDSPAEIRRRIFP